MSCVAMAALTFGGEYQWQVTGTVKVLPQKGDLTGADERASVASQDLFETTASSFVLARRYQKYLVVQYGDLRVNESERSIQVVPVTVIFGPGLVAIGEIDDVESAKKILGNPVAAKWNFKTFTVFGTTGKTADESLALMPMITMPLHRPEILALLSHSPMKSYFGLPMRRVGQNHAIDFSGANTSDNAVTISTPYRLRATLDKNGLPMKLTVRRPETLALSLERLTSSELAYRYQFGGSPDYCLRFRKTGPPPPLERLPFSSEMEVFDYRLVATNPSHSNFPPLEHPKQYKWEKDFASPDALKSKPMAVFSEPPRAQSAFSWFVPGAGLALFAGLGMAAWATRQRKNHR